MFYVIGLLVAVYVIGLFVTYDEANNKIDYKWPLTKFNLKNVK